MPTAPIDRRPHLSARLIATCLGLSLALVAGVSQAAEIAYQSGSACAAGKNDASKINYSTQWGVQNESSSTATVHCPWVYDQHEFEGFVHGELTVVDQHASGNVKCSLLGITPWTGEVGYNAGSKQTSGASSLTQGLTFFDLPNWLTYNATCTLPAAASGKYSRVVAFGTAHLD